MRILGIWSSQSTIMRVNQIHLYENYRKWMRIFRKIKNTNFFCFFLLYFSNFCFSNQNIRKLHLCRIREKPFVIASRSVLEKYTEVHAVYLLDCFEKLRIAFCFLNKALAYSVCMNVQDSSVYLMPIAHTFWYFYNYNSDCV